MLTLVLHNFQMNLFEAYLYDFRMRAKGERNIEEHVVLVKIDDRTTERLNEFSPLSIRQHVNLLERLSNARPKAIAYFIDFNDSLSAESDAQSGPSPADTFVHMAETLHSSGTPIFIGTEIDVTGEVVPPFPLSRLPHRIATIHKDGGNFFRR
jgi:CHASE2 domain-containing sensor protein